MEINRSDHHADNCSQASALSHQHQTRNLRSIAILDARHILLPLPNAQNHSSHRSTRAFCAFSSAVSTFSGRSQRSGTKAFGSKKTSSFRCKLREKATTCVPGGIFIYGPIVNGPSGGVIRGFGEGRFGRSRSASLIAALKYGRDSRACGVGSRADGEIDCSSCWIRRWQERNWEIWWKIEQSVMPGL
jgi:hypothetical protein